MLAQLDEKKKDLNFKFIKDRQESDFKSILERFKKFFFIMIEILSLLLYYFQQNKNSSMFIAFN